MKYYIELKVWEQIFKILKQIKGIHTEDEASLRIFIEDICFIVRSGCQWRLLPNYYGSWRAVHRRFKRWVDFGIWEQLMQYVQESPDLEATMLDTTINFSIIA
jgi:transposase